MGIFGWGEGDSDAPPTASPILVNPTFLWCALFTQMRLRHEDIDNVPGDHS